MMLKNIKTTFLLGALLLSCSYSSAQVKVWLDRDSFLIGEEAQVFIEIPKKMLGKKINLPKAQDTISKMEFLSVPSIDSSTETWKINARVTSFDSGRWEIKDWSIAGVDVPKFEIKVGVPEVDLSKPFRDIEFDDKDDDKKMSKAWIWFLVIFLLLLAAAIYWWYRGQQKKKKDALLNLPPYEKAQAQLDKIEAEKPWEDEEKVKDYYADLTDILRNYFDDEYDTHAMESTSTQFLKDIKKIKRLSKRRKDLAWLFQKADLAKFAKTRPQKEENEEALTLTRKILKWTRPLKETEAKK